jgi:Fe-Mn family superoxide dismutase
MKIIVILPDGTDEQFHTRLDAEDWAVNNGYELSLYQRDVPVPDPDILRATKKVSTVESVVKGLDLQSIVRKALSDAHQQVTGEALDLKEAYVALPKPFRQTTEFSSQDTKNAHEELYKGYVEQLNTISAELDSADLSTTGGRLKFASLKEEETRLSNAVNLHEMYFANCFDPNSELFQDMLAYMKLQADWGDFNRWQMDFQNVALTGQGNGWVVCGYSLFHKRFLNTFISEHSKDVMIGFIPVIVVDVWEHAYARDYLADRKSFVVASMREINWDLVEERVKKIDVLTKVMR